MPHQFLDITSLNLKLFVRIAFMLTWRLKSLFFIYLFMLFFHDADMNMAYLSNDYILHYGMILARLPNDNATNDFGSFQKYTFKACEIYIKKWNF